MTYEPQFRFVVRFSVKNEIRLPPGSKVVVRGKGFSGGNGPGFSSGGGAGHGGNGANMSGTGGTPYGNLKLPTDWGSGGGGSNAGGGAIKLTAPTATIVGTVSAVGLPLATNCSNGGSGVSIHIDVTTLLGGGTIKANGGLGGNCAGAGGCV